MADDKLEFEVKRFLMKNISDINKQIKGQLSKAFVPGSREFVNASKQIADTFMDIAPSVNSATTSAGFQSSLAWMIYTNQMGMWNGDPSKVQNLVDEYMNQVIQYGVACCHHTCKNLDFNSKLIQMSSLTPAQKKQFADILAQATDTDPLYDISQESNSQEEEESSSTDVNKQDGTEGDSQGDNPGGEILVNGTEENQKSDSSQSGGQTAAGNDPSSGEANAKTASDSPDASSDSNQGTGGKAYELSGKSVSKSSSATESSMPIFVIIAVILLIAIFLVGYIRNENDFDEY